MKRAGLLAPVFLAGCVVFSTDHAAREHPESGNTPGGLMLCPGGTTSSRAIWKDGKRTGAVCCRWKRCESVDLEGEPIGGGPHVY